MCCPPAHQHVTFKKPSGFWSKSFQDFRLVITSCILLKDDAISSKNLHDDIGKNVLLVYDDFVIFFLNEPFSYCRIKFFLKLISRTTNTFFLNYLVLLWGQNNKVKNIRVSFSCWVLGSYRVKIKVFKTNI